MEVERSSLCNCVELLDDGRHDQAIRLQEYLSDPQTLLQLKNDSEHKLSITDYQLRLAKLKSQLYVAEQSMSYESMEAVDRQLGSGIVLKQEVMCIADWIIL